MTTVFIRTIILFCLISLTMKIMGKRQIGELQTSELVVAMLISNLASIPMQSVSTPLLHGIIPILTLMSCELIVSCLLVKNFRFRYFIVGVPSLVIRNGVVIQSEMSRLRYTIDDLFEDLRQNNVTDLSDIDYAILETNGKLSIILRPVAQTVTNSDLNNTPYSKGSQLLLVKDGVLNQLLLTDMGFDREWLSQKLKEHHITLLKDIYIMTANQAGEVEIVMKETRKRLA